MTNAEKKFSNDEPAELVPSVEGEVEADLIKSGAATVRDRTLETTDETFGDEGQLAIDVYQTPDEIVIESPIAGVSADDLDIAITNESVTVKGRREHTERVREEDYFYQECYWGRFSRSVILPQEVDPERAEASIKNGVLTVRLPKLKRLKSKKIRVKFE